MVDWKSASLVGYSVFHGSVSTGKNVGNILDSEPELYFDCRYNVLLHNIPDTESETSWMLRDLQQGSQSPLCSI